MKDQELTAKNDWRVGITWDVLIMGFYVLVSLFEIAADPISTNVVSGLLFVGLTYYTYSAYKVQRFSRKGNDLKSLVIGGFFLLGVFLLFSLGNLVLMSSGELETDMSYLNVFLIVALGRSVINMRKLKAS